MALKRSLAGSESQCRSESGGVGSRFAVGVTLELVAFEIGAPIVYMRALISCCIASSKVGHSFVLDHSAMSTGE